MAVDINSSKRNPDVRKISFSQNTTHSWDFQAHTRLCDNRLSIRLKRKDGVVYCSGMVSL